MTGFGRTQDCIRKKKGLISLVKLVNIVYYRSEVVTTNMGLLD